MSLISIEIKKKMTARENWKFIEEEWFWKIAS